MQLSLMQAILLGGWYWFASSHMIYSLLDVYMGTLWAAFVSGIVLGDVVTAMKIGAVIQPMFLAHTGAGGTVVWDEAAATVGGCAITIAGNLPIDQALIIAVPLSLLAAQLSTIRRIVFSYPAEVADRYAKVGNGKGVCLMAGAFCLIAKVVIYWVPMTIALYVGADKVGTLLNAMPAWLVNALSATGGLLPSLGFAMTLRMINRQGLLPFFFAGFFLAQYTGLSGIPLTLVGLFAAFCYYLITKMCGKEEDMLDFKALRKQEGEEKNTGLLQKRDVNRLWLRWNFYAEISNSFARLQALAVAAAFQPILKKLYKDDEEAYCQALQRHLMFFNTEGIWGAMVLGIALSMEEQNAMGAPITSEAIASVKTGLMGPLAGIGDTIDFNTIKPLIIVMVLPLATEGSYLAPLIFLLLFGAYTFFAGLFFTRIGYTLGTRAAIAILQGGMIQTFISCASVLGLFMIGGLCASLVNVATPIAIPMQDTALSVQTDILDAVLPGVLTLLTVMGVYKFLQKGNTMLKATMYLLCIGLVCGALGIIGEGGLLFAQAS